MEENNTIGLSNKLIELLAQKRVIQKEKTKVVKSQKYEEAASLRQQERELEETILENLSNEGKYDFTKSKQMKNDILMIMSLVEEGDKDFSNAISKLSVVDYERIRTIKTIEKYTSGEITIDELHSEINKSFNSVRQDIIKGVQRVIDETATANHSKRIFY